MKKKGSIRFFILLLMVIFSLHMQAQSHTVSGVVRDALSGEELLGVSVAEKGTTNGTMTNMDGRFSLNTAPEAILVISYIGYISQEVALAGQTNLQIELSEQVFALQEVVAIGYGSQKKKEVTGSVASVKAEEFNVGVKTNPIGLVQGKVAGVNIIKTTSDPTSTGYAVQIRGFSTLDKGAGSSPLYIVDGIPVNNIDNISPDEIASMDVLKDGSAAAIYGTRGTNGVIIITTKRGSNLSAEAKTLVEYSAYVSGSTRNRDMGMATPQQFRDLANISGGKVVPVIYTDADGNSFDTDWMKELTRPVALTHNHNLAISGASQKFNYRASLNFKNAEGIAKTTNRQEVIAKLSAMQKALDNWVELQYDVSYMNYRNDYFTGDFKQAAIVNPTYPIYSTDNPNGFFKPQGTGQSNPVEGLYQKESYQDGNYFRGSIKATVNIKPVEGLKVNAFGAIEEGDNHSFWYNQDVNTDIQGSGKAGRGSNFNANKLFELTADYVFETGKHSLTSVAGLSYQNFFYDGMDISNKGFPTDYVKYFQIGNGDASKEYLNADSYRNSNVLAAIFARANYNYDDKYLLSLSLRREGSSRFGVNNKWGYFPAVSTGWRINKEEFMQQADWINDLKLRLGFGVTGNNLASDLQSIAMLGNGGSFWYDGKWVYTYAVTQNPNPDIKWEKKFEYNAGADFSFLKDRLYGSMDFYLRHTRDLLWDYEVPMPPYQYPTMLANAGRMKSYGAELAVSGVVFKNKEWSWTTTPTVAINRNIITKLSDPSKGFNYKQTTSGGVGENGIMNTNTQILIEGEPVGAFYGYEFAGWYRNDGSGRLTQNFKDSDGTWVFKTPQGGYTSEPSEAQRQVVGNAQPLLTYGWNNTVKYKNFDASLFVRGVIGNQILNVTRWGYGPSTSQSMNVFLKDAKDGVYSNKTYFTDYYLENGSYMKLDNLTIGYNVPVKRSNILQSARIYVSGQNLLTITGYSGQDPEVNTTNVWSSGIDYPSFYPTVSNFLIGFNITLL